MFAAQLVEGLIHTCPSGLTQQATSELFCIPTVATEAPGRSEAIVPICFSASADIAFEHLQFKNIVTTSLFLVSIHLLTVKSVAAVKVISFVGSAKVFQSP